MRDFPIVEGGRTTAQLRDSLRIPSRKGCQQGRVGNTWVNSWLARMNRHMRQDRPEEIGSHAQHLIELECGLERRLVGPIASAVGAICLKGCMIERSAG